MLDRKRILSSLWFVLDGRRRGVLIMLRRILDCMVLVSWEVIALGGTP